LELIIFSISAPRDPPPQIPIPISPSTAGPQPPDQAACKPRRLRTSISSLCWLFVCLCPSFHLACCRYCCYLMYSYMCWPTSCTGNADFTIISSKLRNLHELANFPACRFRTVAFFFLFPLLWRFTGDGALFLGAYVDGREPSGATQSWHGCHAEDNTWPSQRRFKAGSYKYLYLSTAAYGKNCVSRAEGRENKLSSSTRGAFPRHPSRPANQRATKS
jgi:hypothetical protein